MIEANARLEYNPTALVQKYRNRAKVAQTILDESVLKDTEQYVRYRTGILARSARTASMIGQGKIIYDTPYARKVYYDTSSDVTRDIHPNATPKWFEESKKKNRKHWMDAVENILKGGNS